MSFKRIFVQAFLLAVVAAVGTVPLHKQVAIIPGGLDIPLFGPPGTYIHKGYPLGILNYTADTHAIYERQTSVSGKYEEYYVLTQAPLGPRYFSEFTFLVDVVFWGVLIGLLLATFSWKGLGLRLLLTLLLCAFTSVAAGIYSRMDVLEFRFGFPSTFLHSLTIREPRSLVYWRFLPIPLLVDLIVWFLLVYVGVLVLEKR